MQGPDYIFAIVDNSNNFYRLDSSGGVAASLQPYFLQYSPDGWNEIEVSNVLNKRLWGVDRSVSVPLNYIKDGAKILKYIFYTKGLDSGINLVICKQHLEYLPGVDWGFRYKKIFKGEIDFSTFDHVGAKVTATTLEAGLPKFLKSNENTVYELPMNVPEAIMVNFDGINLHEKANFITTDGISYVNFRYTPSFYFASHDGNSSGIVIKTQDYEVIAGTAGADEAYVLASENYFYKNERPDPLQVTFTGNIIVKSSMNSTAPLSRSIVKIKTSKAGGTTEYVLLNVTPNAGQVYTFPITLTVTVDPGEKLFLFGTTATVNDALYNFEFMPESGFSASFITKAPATYIRHLTGQYIFEKLIAKVTENNYTAAVSAYFQKMQYKVFTCGDAIRGLNEAVMKISLNNLFVDADCFSSVGMIEQAGKVNIGERPLLIDRVNRITIPSPESPVKLSLLNDFRFNTLKIGYPEIKNDVGVLNSRDEFNTGWNWTIGATVDPKELSKITPIKASCYEQEVIRITLTGKDTTDNKRDNELYANYIDSVLQPAVDIIPAHYLLDRSLNATATGLIEPDTVWNLRLTPKRMLMNNGPWMRSSLYLADQKTLTLASTEKNKDLICDGIIEKSAVNIGSLGNRFFYPVVISFTAPAPDALLELLDVNPLRLAEVDIAGVIYSGILLKSGIAPSSLKAVEYELLLDSENDLKTLIEYNG